ncbi:MAG TPA: hypothetical protein VNE83_07560 [Terriglobales bacterium]|nr:hypothetical protein [Terriglobales bacterium]
MPLRIDQAGRIVIPKPMRERLGFSRQLGSATSRAGARCRQSKSAHKRPAGATQQKVASHLPEVELEAVEQPQGVLIKRAGERATMVRENGLWVHCGVPEPGARWDKVIDEVREERIQAILGLR